MIRDTFDFAAQAQVQALGDAIEYTRMQYPTDPPLAIKAVFGSAFQGVQSGNVRLAAQRPEIMVRLADIPDPAELTPPSTPAEGDRVVARGVTYEVVTVRFDTEHVSAMLTLKQV